MSSAPAVKSKSTLKTLPCGRPRPTSKVQKQPTANVLKTLVSQLNEYCIQKNLNRSETREKILQTITAEVRHFTALDLLARLQKKFPNIGKATLYRNLPVLVKSGVLKEGPHDNNGQSLYELSTEDHHDHIVCLDCRQIFEFHDETIEKRQEHVSSNLNFTARNHQHVIYASCNYLQTTKSN